VIPIFKEQIRKGGPVEVTHPEMKRYFMMIPEAVLLVLQAAEMGQGGEVFVLDMGHMVKIVDLAKEMIRLSGFEPDKDIPIVFTGTRPGEKLYEEILTAEEGTAATHNKKIFKANLSRVDEKELEKSLDEIKRTALDGDKKEIIDRLKRIVPLYK
jgi:FlaA1/EpsC-like NDP-sugar epimerase